ncbi:MAG: tetratricopeptide repeat protein [Syntrophaceae bacterium]|nr:tetratricopeptide repeat protein [Syntrophaceae bacterium]
MKNILPLSAEDFALFQELLIGASGLYFEESKSQFLQLALYQRLQHRGYDSYREYYNLLKFHPEGRLEMRELLDLITIGETYFFRNKPQFDVLMKFVLPEIVQRKMYSRDKSIRVWSAGCSAGDEPYSIAIAIMEAVPFYEEWKISILGTDINRNALACAEEARYGEKSIAHLPKEYLEKYFEIRGSTYRLKENVKELVHLEYHNLAKDPFVHQGMQNVDIIFCRNVIIYFDPQTTRRVIENFYDCLLQDGYLFLGHAETLWQVTNKFEGIEFPQTFTYKKRLGPLQEEAMRPFMAVPEIGFEALTSVTKTEAENRLLPESFRIQPQGKPGFLEGAQTPPPRAEREPDFQEKIESAYYKATLCLREIKDQSPLSQADRLMVQDENDIRACLNQATLLANEAKYKEAAEILAKVVEVDNLSVEAYYLLGVLSYKSGDLEGAQTHFRKVIYVDPDSVLAYFNLGNIYLYQKRFSEAAREFRNAIRLLERRPKDEQVKFCEDFTVEFLLRACRNTLVEISKRGEGYERTG